MSDSGVEQELFDIDNTLRRIADTIEHLTEIMISSSAATWCPYSGVALQLLASRPDLTIGEAFEIAEAFSDECEKRSKELTQARNNAQPTV